MKYKDKLSGKEFTFTPKPDQVMVKFSADVDMLTATKDFEENQIMTPLYYVAPSKGYGCFRLLTEVADVQDLQQKPNIESVFPVVVDNEGNERYFLPGEITVQFKDAISKDDQKKIIPDHKPLIEPKPSPQPEPP